MISITLTSFSWHQGLVIKRSKKKLRSINYKIKVTKFHDSNLSGNNDKRKGINWREIP